MTPIRFGLCGSLLLSNLIGVGCKTTSSQTKALPTVDEVATMTLEQFVAACQNLQSTGTADEKDAVSGILDYYAHSQDCAQAYQPLKDAIAQSKAQQPPAPQTAGLALATGHPDLVSGNGWAESEDPEKGGEFSEAKQIAGLLIGKIDKDYTSKGKRVMRDAHPHAQGCLIGKFQVNPDLDPAMRVGIYKDPPRDGYDALVRFSSSGALGFFPDNKSDARGMAIKLFDVPGQTLLDGAEQDRHTQDFIMINYPIFPTTTASEFQDLAAAGFGNPLPFLSVKSFDQIKLRLVEIGNLTKSTLLRFDDRSLLQMQYFSMSPYLLGEPGSPNSTPIKFSAKPCDDDATRSVSTKPANPGPNYLRDELKRHIVDKQKDICFDFMVQLFKPNKGFAIESAAN